MQLRCQKGAGTKLHKWSVGFMQLFKLNYFIQEKSLDLKIISAKTHRSKVWSHNCLNPFLMW